MKLIFFFLFLILVPTWIWAKAEKNILFKSTIRPIPKKVQRQMRKYTWHKGCPVSLDDLAYIDLSYWGFDNRAHRGRLIVNKQLAHEVVTIFEALFHHKFPIHSMKLMDAYHGDDNASMMANNTSAFNCRPVTDRPGEFSQHSYGRAIDINPLLNPYVKGKTVRPPQSLSYADRTKEHSGTIHKGGVVYQQFIKFGWDWAGEWHDLQDYQHFEKRAGSEKRNRWGYK